MNKGLISVIIPNRKGEKNESLASIKKQTYKKVEIIEVIDAKGEGAAKTRNRGLKKAKGEYIFYCDNDLELDPDCLKVLYNALQENEWADWAFGRFSIDGAEFNLNKKQPPENIYSKEFIDYFHGVSTMSLVKAKCKPFMDESMKRYDDWDLWLTLTRKGHKPVFCDFKLFETKNRPSGISMQNDTGKWLSTLYNKHLKKIADIIIPHHSQHKMLAEVLSRLDNKFFNIIIVSGGTFAQNCNKGARLAETDNLIFLNDDTEPTNELLIKMCEDEHQIVGIAQYVPSTRRTYYGIGFDRQTFHRFLTENPEDNLVPSGFCFKVDRNLWIKLKGLDEIYKNGAEDIDLFLRAKKLNIKFGYITDRITHYLSKSEGRFDFANDNDKILEDRWKDKVVVKKAKKDEIESGFVVKNNFVFGGREYFKGDYVSFDEETTEKIKKIGCI